MSDNTALSSFLTSITKQSSSKDFFTKYGAASIVIEPYQKILDYQTKKKRKYQKDLKDVQAKRMTRKQYKKIILDNVEEIDFQHFEKLHDMWKDNFRHELEEFCGLKTSLLEIKAQIGKESEVKFKDLLRIEEMARQIKAKRNLILLPGAKVKAKDVVGIIGYKFASAVLIITDDSTKKKLVREDEVELFVI